MSSAMKCLRLELVSRTLRLTSILDARNLDRQSAIQKCHRELGTEPRTRSEDNSSLETPLFCWEASINFQIPLGGILGCIV